MVACAVCLRVIATELQTLLVRTSSGDRWTYPKGHVEKGETEVTTAIRELFEESGWKAVSFESRPFAYYEKPERPREPLTACILVTASRRLHEGERGRKPTWFDYPAALLSLAINRTEEEAAPLLTVLERAREELLGEL